MIEWLLLIPVLLIGIPVLFFLVVGIYLCWKTMFEIIGEMKWRRYMRKKYS